VKEKFLIFIMIIAGFAVIMSIGTVLDTGPSYTVIDNDDRVWANSCSWFHIDIDERARSVNIQLEYHAEDEFEIWLIPTEGADDLGPFFMGPPENIRHAVVGNNEVEWTVDRDEFGDMGLTLVEENMFWGAIGAEGSQNTIRFRSERTVTSNLSLLERVPFWIALVAWLILAVLFLYYSRMPKEKVLDTIVLDPHGLGSEIPYGKMEE
jgi:hypothetical protein